MKRSRADTVLGYRISAPRVTPWVPFLLACVLSLPVVVAMLLGLVL